MEQFVPITCMIRFDKPRWFKELLNNHKLFWKLENKLVYLSQWWRTDTFLGTKKIKIKNRRLERMITKKYTAWLALREIQSHIVPRLPPKWPGFILTQDRL